MLGAVALKTDDIVKDPSDFDFQTDNQPLKKRKRKVCQKKRRLFDRYFGGSEIHGIKIAFAENTIGYWKAFWIVVIAVSFIVSGFTTNTVIEEYLLHQTATHFTVKQVRKLNYPTAIVCPKNPDALDISAMAKEIRRTSSEATDEEVELAIAYAVADAGFANMDKKLSNISSTEPIRDMVLRWRNHRPVDVFYRHIFGAFGFQCEQVCRVGSVEFDCCDYFVEHYLMLRGRCFKLETIYQIDPHIDGRLYVELNELPAPLTSDNDLQPQMVVYIGRPGKEVTIFPRFYISRRAYNTISCQMRILKMLPHSGECIDLPDYGGHPDCYIRAWQEKRLVEPLNCTTFYLHQKHLDSPICETGVIYENYKSIQNLTTDSICLPECERQVITCQHEVSEETPTRQNVFKDNHSPAFQFEYGFTDLEYEYYEEFKTTTVPGFVSEIGGQLGLFTGVSVSSVIQLATNLAAVFRTLQRRRRNRRRRR